jgi:hypothetical protein
LRCPRCGNENPESNRFCGMCGATLRPGPAPVQTAAHAATQVPVASPPMARSTPAPSPTSPVQNVTASRPAPSATAERSASISGPSFLGLNDPPPQKRSSLSITQGHDSSSRNLDYLLDDEEPPRSGAWKLLFIIAVLAVAAALGYMRWKNPSLTLGSLFSRIGKPAAATQPSTTADANPPDTSAGTAATPSSTPPPSTPADTTPAPAENAAPDRSATTETTDKSASADKTAPAETPAASTPAPDNTAASHPPVAPPVKPKHRAEPDPNLAPPVAATRRTAAPAPPAKLGDSITEAQKYIYGKGVQQDCDHGLRLLKPAADRANPKAMIEMGALYSAGLCTPHDLPTAYRWFALALRKEPDNQSVQTDLQKLWGEMTQPERQLAIKLSQ